MKITRSLIVLVALAVAVFSANASDAMMKMSKRHCALSAPASSHADTGHAGHAAHGAGHAMAKSGPGDLAQVVAEIKRAPSGICTMLCETKKPCDMKKTHGSMGMGGCCLRSCAPSPGGDNGAISIISFHYIQDAAWAPVIPASFGALEDRVPAAPSRSDRPSDRPPRA